MSSREHARARLRQRSRINPAQLQKARTNVLATAQERVNDLRDAVYELDDLDGDVQHDLSNMNDSDFVKAVSERWGLEIIQEHVLNKLPQKDFQIVHAAPAEAQAEHQCLEAVAETIRSVTGKSISEFASDQQRDLIEAFPDDAPAEETNARLLSSLAGSFGPDAVLDAFERGDLDEEDFREAGLMQQRQAMTSTGLPPEMQAQVDSMSTQDLAKLIDTDDDNGFTEEPQAQAAEIQPDDPPHISPDDLTDEQLRGLIDG